jgi:hypothetical protein
MCASAGSPHALIFSSLTIHPYRGTGSGGIQSHPTKPVFLEKRRLHRESTNSGTGRSSIPIRGRERAIVASEANLVEPSRGDFDAMARRRFQNPKPKIEGHWWVLYYWQDEFTNGKRRRRRKRDKLALATMREREVLKIASEFLRPINQGLVNIGSATTFSNFVDGTYIPVVMPQMARAHRIATTVSSRIT